MMWVVQQIQGGEEYSRVKLYINALSIQIDAVVVRTALFEGVFAAIDIVEINSTLCFGREMTRLALASCFSRLVPIRLRSILRLHEFMHAMIYFYSLFIFQNFFPTRESRGVKKST
jgi:hypothetical protein